jgi:hypothetical protein
MTAEGGRLLPILRDAALWAVVGMTAQRAVGVEETGSGRPAIRGRCPANLEGSILRLLRQTSAASRQFAHPGPIGTQQCLLVRLQPLIWRSTAMPSTMRSKCSDQTRTTGRLEKVYPLRSRVMLINARREIIPCRTSDIIRAVRATKHVNIYTHRRRPSRRASARTSG